MDISQLLVAGLIFLSPTYSSNQNLSVELEAQCLALNMYHESRDQGSAGLLGVSSVVLNRVKDERFPYTICEVVEQGPTR